MQIIENILMREVFPAIALLTKSFIEVIRG